MLIEITSDKKNRGFALVATLLMMILLSILAVGLLSLSTVSLRSSTSGTAMVEAQANARLAMMLAIGELQKEMGPDMRVSAEAALFDQNPDSERIEGIAQPHWMGIYNSWGNWINASYTLPDGGSPLSIQDTYTPGRENMFRRWLLSMPAGAEDNMNAPVSLTGWDDENSVVLVGKGSLGQLADDEPERVTRAYLTSVGNSGKNAWWIGPENQKARADIAKSSRNLTVDESQASQGNTAEVGVGALPGFEILDNDAAIGEKLISARTLAVAGIDDDEVKTHFFDLTSQSKGVLASVRSGHLKKDLSLLLEKDNADLPAPYKFNVSTDSREPSIRPMSPDLVAKNPQIAGRHFQSWTNMRHYYRMYRTSSDSTVAGTNASAVLRVNGDSRWTELASPTGVQSVAASAWKGSNAYQRVPVVAKITFIHSLMAEFVSTNRYRLFLVYSPVYTLWNPYNVELRIPDNKWTIFSAAYRVWPFAGQMYAGTTPISGLGNLDGSNVNSPLRSGTAGQDIVFKPGEFRVFSHSTRYQGITAVDLVPGFDPQAIGGQRMQLPAFPLAPPPSKAARLWAPSDNPGFMTTFSHSIWGGNVNNGNTPGSLDLVNGWQLTPTSNSGLASNYQIDWFKKEQCYTRITKESPSEIARFSFADGNPVPVAYHQLVIKGLSEFNYESINWGNDWRSRNWIQSPPFYFGSALYASENDRILHTQRIDCPYVVNFGPTSMVEIPKLVFHDGSRAFLGSGSNPFEKVGLVAALELPTAPIGSLAGFAAMRINPGWTNASQMNTAVNVAGYNPPDVPARLDTRLASMSSAYNKSQTYQSGITGPGIGNSFLHPMIPRTDVYQFFDNSWSQDPLNRQDPLGPTQANNNKFYNDYWDHVFLLNDALWDDYFVSSLADQTRPGATGAFSLQDNLNRLVAGNEISNSRYRYESALDADDVLDELEATDGYLKAAKHLVVDGMFNVNSTSVAAWYALFAGIRERELVYRDENGELKKIDIPSGKRIAISRFDTEVSDQEMENPGNGVTMPDGSPGWSGVRFLDDSQLKKLAEECVKQVKKRGPFLNFSEFINRRLSDDELGTMGALQSAIDYDDDAPEAGSINYNFKSGTDFMLEESDLGTHEFQTPEAAVGSRFAGIPGYVIQSDILKPIANTLSVRDDTFRIRAYGESLDKNGNVAARAWCEAIVQRVPEYYDSSNSAEIPMRELDAQGSFVDANKLTVTNQRFGRRFKIVSFKWLNENEV